ncbi:YqjF family protein, partial [Natrinema altunense]
NVDVRPRGVPAAAGVDLPELNLRTYVSRDGEPGVYFFSLDAAGALGVVGARLFHRLPYYYADIEIAATDRGIAFTSERRHPGAAPARFVGTYEPVGDSFTPDPDSLAGFLTEHYRYYTTARDGTLRYADIDHEPWTLRAATATVETNTLFEANGFEPPAGSPVCYYSRGVDIASSRNRRWE